MTAMGRCQPRPEWVESGHFVAHGATREARPLRRNFQFDGVSVVRWGDSFIDLHNAYDLEAFGTEPTGSEVYLSFKRNAHAIDPDRLPSKVALTCSGSVRVAFNDLTAIAAPLDD